MANDLKSADNRQILIEALDAYERIYLLKAALCAVDLEPVDFYRIKRANPDLADRYELILRDKADAGLHRAADIADNLFHSSSEIDPRRARVGLDATFTIAKFMDRARFGDHVQIEATHNVSLVDALAQARQRTALPDPNIIEGEAVTISSARDNQAPTTIKRRKRIVSPTTSRKTD